MRSRRLTLILRVLLGVFAALFLMTAAAGVYLYRLSLTLPDLEVGPDSLRAARTSVVYASDGTVLAEWHGEQDRTVIPFESIPEPLRDAVVAVEDERFYEHNGVDIEAVTRALRANAGSAGVQQGGSTITQQLVKLLFTDGERTLTRKAREALLAYELENRADKEKVLETYLNVIYFGEGTYGAESAARTYFGKSASQLDLPEAALLAGVIRAPGRYSPVSHPEAARERRDLVLGKMADQGYITDAEERDARAEPVEVVTRTPGPARAPYFVEYVKQDLIERLGPDAVYTGGLRVRTTLDPKIQAEAEKAARSILEAPGDPEVALVTVRPSDGHIVAMVGGRDFAINQFNLAAQGRRQPGSAFKPFVLVAALEAGVRPEDVFKATPYSVEVTDGVWTVDNYENDKTAPSMTLRTATNWSVNGVYARLIMKVGPRRVVETARRMGIVTPLEPNPAIALGGLSKGVSPLEMASAYATLANGGVHTPVVAVIEVADDRGRRVWVPDTTASRAVPARIAVQASLMLHDVVERGTGTAARFGTWAAGKTGTTQSYRDAWFVGWAGDLSTAVWVGHRAGQVEMTNVHGTKVTGGSFPAQIWKRFMERAVALDNAPVGAASAPVAEEATTTAVSVRICTDSLLLANKRCPKTVEMYLEPALVPKSVCDRH